MPQTLEQLILERVSLGKVSNTGFHKVKCPICHDYQERGGFKFDNGTVGFSCFNCGYGTRYDEGTDHISRKMRDLLEAFDFSSNELNKWLYELKVSDVVVPEKEITLASISKVNLVAPEILLPNDTYPLGYSEYEDDQAAIVEYLLDRQLDPLSYPYYFSLAPKLDSRVIIPFYRRGKLIYWQARAIDGAEPRYRNAVTTKEAVIFNIDELSSWESRPLFVHEGVMDALSVGGISVIGSKLNEAKLELLRRSDRRLVFVTQRDANGRQLAEMALNNGWEITFPPGKAKDANAAIIEYGKLFTIYTLMNGIMKDSNIAHAKIRTECVEDKQQATYRRKK